MQKALSDYIRLARQQQITRLPRDEKLTRQHLVPVSATLVKLVQRHRQEADAFFAQNPPPDPADREFPMDAPDRPSAYPLGCCRQIRDRVWDSLSKEPFIRSLRRYGLTWKKVYIIDHECWFENGSMQEGYWFQNSIQCGDWILDAAHDTMDVTDPPVVCAPLGEYEWENLDDWRRFAEVAAYYYRVTVYPNLYFPLLFPLIPFLAIRETGRLELLYCQQNLFLLDLGEDLRRCMALLQDRTLMEKSLPPAVEKRLLELGGEGSEPFPVELRKCTAESLGQALSEWDQIRGLPNRQLVDTIQNYMKLAGLAARRLRKADIAVDLSA
jgi:hypothetical protein